MASRPAHTNSIATRPPVLGSPLPLLALFPASLLVPPTWALPDDDPPPALGSAADAAAAVVVAVLALVVAVVPDPVVVVVLPVPPAVVVVEPLVVVVVRFVDATVHLICAGLSAGSAVIVSCTFQNLSTCVVDCGPFVQEIPTLYVPSGICGGVLKTSKLNAGMLMI
jgi:hypothetical protein